MANYSAALDTTFRALSDPTRRAVINRLLIVGPVAVKELAQPFQMGLPSFMKHIKVLEDSGLITSRKTGRVRMCRIEPRQLVAVGKWLSEQRTLWEGRADRLAKYAERLTVEEQ